MKLDSVISLGIHCEPALQFRRFFKKEPCSPFDWLITYPLDSLFKIFNDDGASFGDEVTFAMDGTSTQCVNYGCFYHHEFKVNANGKVIISAPLLKNCKDKLQHKYLKMIDLAKNSKPLFVRWVHGAEYPSNSLEYIFTSDEINRLKNVIRDKIHHNDFHISFVGTKNNKFTIVDPSALTNIANISAHVYESINDSSDQLFWNNFYTSFGFVG